MHRLAVLYWSFAQGGHSRYLLARHDVRQAAYMNMSTEKTDLESISECQAGDTATHNDDFQIVRHGSGHCSRIDRRKIDVGDLSQAKARHKAGYIDI
jgi:hypothetical protein